MTESEIAALIETSDRLVEDVSLDFKRSLHSVIDWTEDLVCIKGPKGTGKTTLILQHIKETFGSTPENAVYFSLDNVWFADHNPIEAIDYFYKNGNTNLFIDEVHYHPEWPRLIKTATDSYPGLKIVFSGSSILKIEQGRGDLSRRATVYDLKGMSFREFLEYDGHGCFPIVTYDDLKSSHRRIAAKVCRELKIIPLFKKYLKSGYYPFYKKSPQHFTDRLREVVNNVLTVDLPMVEGITPPTVRKARKMLMILAKSCPQQPNMSELYRQLETERNMGLRLLSALERAQLFTAVDSGPLKLKHLSRPEKIFLGDTNLMNALVPQFDVGAMRETYFVNQLQAAGHALLAPMKGDFIVDEGSLFEIGGESKGFSQIRDIPDSYVVNDDVEIGHGNKIPLWLFGFLY